MTLTLSGWWRMIFGPRRERASGRAPVELAPRKPVLEAVHPGVMDELARGRKRLAERLEDLKSLTEREILACGSVFSSIVDKVREVIAETDRSAAASMARSEELTSRFIREMQEDIRTQETAVKEVLVLADGIEAAIEAINGLSQYSNILAINARIEAARFGDRGRGFAVIADHMRELSGTIRETADKVSSSIGAVRQGLPAVGERASSMQHRTRSFIEVVAQQVKSSSLQTDAAGTSGSGRLDVVMELSNKGLSHLQFQDPMTQKLSLLNREFDVVASRVRRVLEGGTNPEAGADDRALDESLAGAGQPAPGKITLFEAGDDT